MTISLRKDEILLFIACVFFLIFRELKGVIVTLDEYGHLSCCYLGTDPSLFSAPAVESRNSNFSVSSV